MIFDRVTKAEEACCMEDEESKEKARLTLVSDNPSIVIDKLRDQQNLNIAEVDGRDAIRQLAVNLLRIIAGAGEPWALIKDIDHSRSSYLAYLELAKSLGQSHAFMTSELNIDNLFAFENEREPITEEEWQRWAQPKSAWDDYREERRGLKLQLRRAVLRQVASILSSGEKREPHLRAHGGDLDEIIDAFSHARTRLERLEAKPKTVQADVRRQELASQEIALLRGNKRKRQIESLAQHHIAGLRAVRDRDVGKVDGFTLDVLGRMKLLGRPKGSKKKTDWHLTDDGVSALKLHEPELK